MRRIFRRPCWPPIRTAPGAVEALLNQALQHSNLGSADEADDPVRAGRGAGRKRPGRSTRMLRNYRAIHLINQGQRGRRARRARQAASARRRAAASGRRPTRRSTPRSRPSSTPSRPAARGLRGAASRSAARSSGRGSSTPRRSICAAPCSPGPAAASRRGSRAGAGRSRAGRRSARAGSISTLWLRAQIHGELAAIAEEQRRSGRRRARASTRRSPCSRPSYPGSPALLSARARLAAFLAPQPAGPTTLWPLYRQIVDANRGRRPALADACAARSAPYFALLVREAARPGSVAEMFKASQLLVRPGVAQTQAVLARELSGGSDEASRLFRQSVDLARDIERAPGRDRRGSPPCPRRPPRPSARLAALRAELSRGWRRARSRPSRSSPTSPRYRVVSRRRDAARRASAGCSGRARPITR